MEQDPIQVASDIVKLAMIRTYNAELAESYPHIPQQVVEIAHWEVWPANCEAIMWAVC